MNYLLSLILIIIGLLPFSPVHGESSPKVKLGAILPLTGDVANIGKGMKDSMQLAYDHLSPELRDKIELTFEDDGMVPRNSVAAFRKLVDIDKVDVVMSVASNTSKSISPIADEIKVPIIAIASDIAVVRNRAFAVNLWVTPEQEAKVMLPEVRRRGYKNIARVTSLHDGTLATNKAFDAENHNDAVIVLDEEFPMDVKDFRPVLTKIKAKKNIDAILANLFIGQVGLFAKQAKQLGMTLPLFTFELFEDANEVKMSEGALVGQWYSQADDGTGEFLSAFTKAFPGASLFGAANAYDTVMLVAEAIKQGSTTRAAINMFLHQVKDFHGALGTYSATGDNRFTLPATLKVVTATGFEKMK